MHARNTVRYYVLLVVFLLFLFFTNDFGLLNIQKTAIVTAVAIDKEETDFVLTAQIAVPTASSGGGGGAKQSGSGGSENFATVEGRGATVAAALDEVNAKTGWYPKLVFCNLIICGEELAKGNVFDALDFFLRDEYAKDSCLVTACDGKAGELLGAKTPLGNSAGLAIEKVLSDHAKRLGTAFPATLREFASGYFGGAKSGYLPLLKKQTSENGELFEAGSTALFVDGKRVGELTKEETFTLSAVKNDLRLADYVVPFKDEVCVLSIKQNKAQMKLSVEDGEPRMRLTLRLYAGMQDASRSYPVTEIADAGDIPDGLFAVAEERMKGEVTALFEKCRALNFDVFDALEKLQKYESKHFDTQKDSLTERLQLSVEVRFGDFR